ncbi:MAG: nickel-responsive transcriptional regulator NikR [Candidatus Omnitrophica bacterium]|nr:nickel-responsive transcriptional regulator NikR [Candidatus Omnitrophota bacterium]MBU4345935.1 nickel-responsive transcriptional regulator NikR [Candidatus Omnitrophota bacterium]MBU4473367.1 nickel-responsive transcriptional regulator NikR [Candidatus Omnitrophota bacterium]MCG2706495.1 nickel-responsive transcriptional regulator NikR [Candidatus Omnitrophota bacterium]
MPSLVRFGVSLEKELLCQFDGLLKNTKYTNRSQAIRDLIRTELVKEEWQENKEITGAVTLVYNHHKRELVNRLMDIQHDYHDNILSTQHLHLDGDNCLEVIAIKGKAKQTKELYDRLRSVKGVKYAGFAQASTGSRLT